MSLNREQLLDYYARIITNRLKTTVHKLNVPGKYYKRKKETRIRGRHYMVIGELSVKYASTEQMLKYLLRYFDLNKGNDRLSGVSIIKALRSALKNSPVDNSFKERISVMLEKFRPLAIERHRLVKVLWAYNKQGGSMVKMNLGGPIMDVSAKWEKDWRSFFPPFDEKRVQDLLSNMKNLNNEIMSIQHDLAVSYFLDAKGNVYDLRGEKKVGTTFPIGRLEDSSKEKAKLKC